MMFRSITVSPLEGIFPPAQEALWGWFKFNEGSGTTIIDYSPTAVNGSLQTSFGDPTTKFWSVPGFGHNNYTSPITWFYRYTTSRASYSVAIVGFVRPRGYDPDNLWYRGCAQIGEGGSTNWLRIGWSNSSTNRWRIYCGNIYNPITTTAPVNLNTWVFYYVHSTTHFITGRYRLEFRLRYSGGPLNLIYSTNTLDYLRYAPIQGLFAFGGNNDNYHMDGGDILYYISDTTTSILSETKINYIYDTLKSRYGMT